MTRELLRLCVVLYGVERGRQPRKFRWIYWNRETNYRPRIISWRYLLKKQKNSWSVTIICTHVKILVTAELYAINDFWNVHHLPRSFNDGLRTYTQDWINFLWRKHETEGMIFKFFLKLVIYVMGNWGR